MTYRYDDEHDIEVHHPHGDSPYWAHLLHRKTLRRVVERVESNETNMDRACKDLEAQIAKLLKEIN